MGKTLNTYDQVLYALQVQLVNFVTFSTIGCSHESYQKADLADLIMYRDLYDNVSEMFHDSLYW